MLGEGSSGRVKEMSPPLIAAAKAKRQPPLQRHPGDKADETAGLCHRQSLFSRFNPSVQADPGSKTSASPAAAWKVGGTLLEQSRTCCK